jgi:hypothetical protein
MNCLEVGGMCLFPGPPERPQGMQSVVQSVSFFACSATVKDFSSSGENGLFRL